MKAEKKSILLLRGIPGSGKSTLAEVIAEEGKYPVFSIDSYFTDAEGNYSFDFRENHLAYKACEEATRSALKDGVQKVIVDNTFTMDWEMEPYFKLAAEFSYRIFVVTVENRHGNSNLHDIPEEHVQKMREKFRVVL